jgi:hypothetical protein
VWLSIDEDDVSLRVEYKPAVCVFCQDGIHILDIFGRAAFAKSMFGTRAGSR